MLSKAERPIGDRQFNNSYGKTVRGRLLSLIHEIGVAGEPAGVTTHLTSGLIQWHLQSAGAARGIIGCKAEISGSFPHEFVIDDGWIEIDDGNTSMQVARRMRYSMNRDPFALDFLAVVTDAYCAYEEEFCLAALAQAEVSRPDLVTLRSAGTGEVLVP